MKNLNSLKNYLLCFLILAISSCSPFAKISSIADLFSTQTGQSTLTSVVSGASGLEQTTKASGTTAAPNSLPLTGTPNGNYFVMQTVGEPFEYSGTTVNSPNVQTTVIQTVDDTTGAVLSETAGSYQVYSSVE